MAAAPDSARQPTALRRTGVLGIPIAHVTVASTLSWIGKAIADRRPRYICTPNVDYIVKTQSNPAFRKAILGSDLIVADSHWVVWATAFLGDPVPEVVAGSNLVVDVSREAAGRGWRLFLLGAAPGVGDHAAGVLRERFPGLVVVGTASPPIGFQHDREYQERLTEQIRRAAPDVMFVALGAPLQEVWIHAHHKRLGVPVIIGIGSGLDYLGGKIKRAPEWAYNVGLEWLFRLRQEPGRLWRRYLLDDTTFFYLLLRQRIER